MAQLTSTEWALAQRPVGLPQLSDFQKKTTDVPEPGDGEIQVKNEWMSVDPYMRGRMYDRESYVPPFQIGETMQGGAIGRVTASNHPGYGAGDLVSSMAGWRTAWTAKPEAVPTRERLTFLFSDTTDAAASLDLDWAGTRVRLPITVATAANAKANIGDFSKKSSRALANAARYLADDAKDVDGALKLIDSSLAVDVTWFNTWLKADFLARKGDKKAALALAEKAYALGKDDKGFFYKDRVEKALKDWK